VGVAKQLVKKFSATRGIFLNC